MYTIDKKYLKDLKQRLYNEFNALGIEICKDCTDEQRESLMARQSCLERTISNVQNIINNMILLELAEQAGKGKDE